MNTRLESLNSPILSQWVGHWHLIFLWRSHRPNHGRRRPPIRNVLNQQVDFNRGNFVLRPTDGDNRWIQSREWPTDGDNIFGKLGIEQYTVKFKTYVWSADRRPSTRVQRQIFFELFPTEISRLILVLAVSNLCPFVFYLSFSIKF